MTTKRSYKKKDLDKYVEENEIESIGEYENVNRDTRIKGKCKTTECEGIFDRTFRQIVEKGGALCKSCINGGKQVYDNKFLYQYIVEKNIELLKNDDNQEYSNVTVNRDTKINGKCLEINCKNSFQKGFRQLVKIGAYCDTCTKEKGLIKSKQTSLENYGVENPSQCEEIKKKKIETRDINHPKIEPKEETIKIDINGIQEKFKPIYEILKKNKCTTVTINNYKKQEKYICNNSNILDIKYIESNKKDVPFDKIIWIIKCNCCDKIVEDWCWAYNNKSKGYGKGGSKSIINIGVREKNRGIENLENLYNNPFFDTCLRCSDKKTISSFNQLVLKLKDKNPQLLIEYDIIDDENYKYPIYVAKDMIKLKYKKTGEIISSHMTYISKNIPIPTSQRTIGVSKESIYCLDFISLYCKVKILHAYNNIHGEHLSPKSWKKADGYIENIELDIFKLLEKNILSLCNNLEDIIIYYNEKNTKCILEYQGKLWHDKEKNKIRDEEKKNEFFNNGYNIIIINQVFYNKLIKTDLYKKYLSKLHEIWLTYDQNIETKLPERIKMSEDRKKNKELPIYITQRKEDYYRVKLNITQDGELIDICKYGFLGKTTQKKNGQSHLCFSFEELKKQYLKPISDILCKFINKEIQEEEKNNIINILYQNYIKQSLNKKIDFIKQDIYNNLYTKQNKNSQTIELRIKFIKNIYDELKIELPENKNRSGNQIRYPSIYSNISNFNNTNKCKLHVCKFLDNYKL